MRTDNSKHTIAKSRAERLASDRRRLLLPTNRLPPATRVDEPRSILRDESSSASQNQIAAAHSALSLLSDVDEGPAATRCQGFPAPGSALHGFSAACLPRNRGAQLKAEPASVAEDEDRNRF